MTTTKNQPTRVRRYQVPRRPDRGPRRDRNARDEFLGHTASGSRKYRHGATGRTIVIPED